MTAAAERTDEERAAALHRRQVVLAVSAAAVFVVTMALVAVAARQPVHWAFAPSHGHIRWRVAGTKPLFAAIVAGLTATFVLLLALVVHAMRVATFALRREVH